MQTRFWLSHKDLTGKDKHKGTLISSPSSPGWAGMVKEKPVCRVMHEETTRAAVFNSDTAMSPGCLPFSMCNSGHQFQREDLKLWQKKVWQVFQGMRETPLVSVSFHNFKFPFHGRLAMSLCLSDYHTALPENKHWIQISSYICLWMIEHTNWSGSFQEKRITLSAKKNGREMFNMIATNC